MIKMKELPYPLNALEPYYNQDTLDIHYNILYKGYVDNTNKTKEKLEDARKTNDFSAVCAKAAYEAFHFAAAFYMLALLDNPCLIGFVES